MDGHPQSTHLLPLCHGCRHPLLEFFILHHFWTRLEKWSCLDGHHLASGLRYLEFYYIGQVVRESYRYIPGLHDQHGAPVVAPVYPGGSLSSPVVVVPVVVGDCWVEGAVGVFEV